jgi:hypothetical protein
VSLLLRSGVRFLAARDENPPVAFEEVRQGGVVEDGGGGVPNVEEEVEEPGVAGFGLHQAGELGGIAERGERPVEESHDVSDDDLGRRAAKLVASLPAPAALHDPGVLEGQEDRFEKLLGNLLASGDLVRRDGPSVPPFRKVEERLEGIEAALGDFQMYPYGSSRIFGNELRVKENDGGGGRDDPAERASIAVFRRLPRDWVFSREFNQAGR